LLAPGLFYRFRYGADIEFLCVDTSKQSLLSGDRLFKKEKPLQFLAQALPAVDGTPSTEPIWRIPFMHHPPYTAGPTHHNSRSIIDVLVPLFKRAGVRVVFSGHEHNFQHVHCDGIHYIITGASGKVTLKPPARFVEAHTVAWAAAGHFLLVEVNHEQMSIRPIATLAAAQPLSDVVLRDTAQQPVATPLVISRAGAKQEEVEGPAVSGS
jgi:3',5'-cyclic AMP phosphodiesterase CpdA